MLPPINKKIERGKSIIEKCFGGLKNGDLGVIANNYSKLIVKDSFEEIVSGGFKMPSRNDIEQMLNQELKWNFDEEEVVADIKNNYPSWSDDQVYDEADKLSDIYENEYSVKIESIFKAMVRECQGLVVEMQKEVTA